MWLLLPFVVLPIVEIALFILVGGEIGVLPTILLVILSAVAGMAVIRRQGLAARADLQRAMTEMRDPTDPLAHGALILLAGMLLILPGFFTDALGIALLIPPVRRALIAAMGRRVRVSGAGFSPGFGAGFGPGPQGRGPRGDGRIIEADYVVVDDEREGPPRPDPGLIDNPTRTRPSGWTRD